MTKASAEWQKTNGKPLRRLRPAADQVNRQAQHNLAIHYEQGRGGLAKNEREAARLYKLAADQGLIDAQSALNRLGRR